MVLFARGATQRVMDALADTPVVVVHGPRQAGKSTLVRDLLTGHDAHYVTFDEMAPRAAATRDPEGFVAGLPAPVVLDEVQRVPDLVLAIKAEVDRDRRPGRFLLTGSADIFAQGQVDDSLAGRRETVRLWSLAQAEIDECPAMPDAGRLFARDLIPDAPPVTAEEVTLRMLRGGYPEAVRREGARRDAWLDNYLDEVVRFEIADLRAIEGLLEMPTLLRLLSLRNAGLLNYAHLARDLEVSPRTVKRYVTLLVHTFLVQLVPAWTRSERKRLVKSPKAVIADSGLATRLAAVSASAPPAARGGHLEAFVLAELRRHLDAAGQDVRLYHFRTDQQHEVDAVLEHRDGRIVGIEVKSTTSIRASDFRGLEQLAEAAGDRFVRGLVLHPGRAAVPFGDNLWAAPLSLLWSA